MKVLYKILSIATVALAAMSCTDMTTYDNMGIQPDVVAMGNPVLSLRAEQAPDNVVSLMFTEGAGEESATRKISIHSTVPVDDQYTIVLTADGEEAVKAYSEQTRMEYKLLPVGFYSLKRGKYMEMNPGETESAANELTIYSKNLLGNVLEPGHYLLPLTGTSADIELQENTVYVDVTVREQFQDPDGVEVYEGDDMFTVFYINTSAFDPRLATDMVLIHNLDAEYARGLGNIVNLRTSSVDYDNVTGKVSVRPSNDLRYILDHYSERVLPVQESGRKVCVCIEGGGKGIGFCNFTDGQIAEFVASVKRMVETYGLDGINLWDRNSGYEKSVENGFPEMNTTSYPKLIKALRESLGSDKLLTVVDYEQPTEYFHDVTATEGIEVGKYINYAWSGYCDESEPVQIVDPWHQDAAMVSAHKRAPMAGLASKNYGCVNATIYINYVAAKAEVLTEWTTNKYNPNNIMVFYDIRSNIQDKYEGGGCWNPLFIIKNWYNDYTLNMNFSRLDNIYTEENPTRYNKWGKDW